MRKNLLTLVFLSCALFVFSQDKSVRDLQAAGTREVKSLDSNGWMKGGTFILNLNQGALSNWAAGGEQNVFGINGILNYAVNYRGDRNTWDNYFELALGFQNATSFNKFRKIDDRVDITSKYGHKIGEGKWSYGLLANINTQLLQGFDYGADTSIKISSFFSPGKILVSPGFNYQPDPAFSFFISPVTVRWLFKTDPDFLNINKFGVDSAKKVYTEIGAFATARYTRELSKWATYTGRLDLFSNYRRNPQNVDVLMTNLLSMKFTKSLATTISLDIIYDDDILQKTQVKEILGIGLSLKL